VPDDEIDLLRSVLARAYENRQPLRSRLIKGLWDRLGSRTQRNPVIESLNIIEEHKIEKNKDAA